MRRRYTDDTIVVKKQILELKNIFENMFYTSIKTIKTYNKNMFDIGCVTCRYRISEGSKAALSGDLNTVYFLKVTSQQLIAN